MLSSARVEDASIQVVAWGSTLSVLANYFDPWCPTSKKWFNGCKLVIITRGPATDEEFAALKIDADVDLVAAGLLERLGLEAAPYVRESDPFLARVVRDGPAPCFTFATASRRP